MNKKVAGASSSSATKPREQDAPATLVPRLRFPEFRDAEGWVKHELGPKTSKIGSGITPSGGDKNYKLSGRPFVRSQNVGWGVLLLNDVVYIDEQTHASFNSTEIKTNDVLLNITGASIGRSVVSDKRITGGNVNQHVCVIRTKIDELVPLFLNQFLISQFGQKQIDSFQAGGNRQGLNFAQIRSFTIPLPPSLPEQQRIADCLSSLDALITAQARKVDALKSHKKGLMQQLFPRDGETQPRLRFPEFQDAGEWEEKKLHEVALFFKGKGISKAEISANGQYSCIRYGELYTRYGEVIDEVFSRTDVAESGLFFSQSNDVIIPASGETKLDIAKASCVIRDNVALGGDLNVIRTDNNGVFLSYYLNGPKRQDIAKVAQGDTVVHLYPSQLEKLVIVLPSLPEQQRIADCLSSLDALISAATQRLAALKTHKQGLMQQLFPNVAGASSSADIHTREQDAPATHP